MGSRRYRQRVYEAYKDTLAPELEIGQARDSSVYFPHFDAHYLPRLPADKSARILDAGCGQGFFLQWLEARGYANISGVDGSPQMVELARKRGLDVERGDMVEFLRAHPATYDCVTATDVLEHFDKDELIDLADAAFAALKGGGMFVVHTVNADGLAWGRTRYIDLTHETAFTRYSLSQLFSVAGFKGHEFHAVWPAGSGVRAALRRALFGATRLAVGLLHHAEGGSGILRNDHIVSSALIGKATKPR